MRSRNNAVRHGLASSVANDPEVAKKIEHLASVLVKRSRHALDIHQAHALAESEFERMRIKEARDKIIKSLSRSLNSDETTELTNALIKISRYEERASSKRRRLMRTLTSYALEPQSRKETP